jgi:hypothetical protein
MEYHGRHCPAPTTREAFMPALEAAGYRVQDLTPDATGLGRLWAWRDDGETDDGG